VSRDIVIGKHPSSSHSFTVILFLGISHKFVVLTLGFVLITVLHDLVLCVGVLYVIIFVIIGILRKVDVEVSFDSVKNNISNNNNI